MSLSIAGRGPIAARLGRAADWLALALVVSLPWSTSATSVLAVCWIFAVLPTLDRQDWQSVARIAGAVLPVVLVAYAVIGMLWADVAWVARVRGVAPYTKLLLIPLLFMHFRRSDRANLVLNGFLVSVCILMAASWFYVLMSDLSRNAPAYGVPVKDYISQSGLFALTIAILADRAISGWKTAPYLSLALGSLALLFLANIVFIAAGRTTLVSLAVLAVVLGFRRFSRLTLTLFLGGLVAICAIAWTSSPYLRFRVASVTDEIRDYRPREVDTSSGARLEFWRQSAEIIGKAPLFGHGTGSTREVMSRNAGVDPGAVGAPANPHNQILAVAIPLGLAGVALLLAMWLAHGRMFLLPGHVAWIGLAVVAQNIVGSLFNSHLFDFSQGWLYVLGVGIAGGALMRENTAAFSQTVKPS